MYAELRPVWFTLKSKYGEVSGEAEVYVVLEDASFDHEFGTQECFFVRLDEIEKLIIEGKEIDYDKLKDKNQFRVFNCIDEYITWSISPSDVESSLKESRIF